MKKMKKYLAFFILSVIVLMSSCSSDNIRFSGQKETAKRGVIVTKSVSDLYSTLYQMNYYFQYKKEYLQILTKSDTSLNNLYKDIRFDKTSLDSMSAFVQKITALYSSYETLTELSVNVEKSGIVYNVDRFCKAASSLTNSEDDKVLIDNIYKAAHNSKFERKDIFYAASTLFVKIIGEDLDSQAKILAKMYESYEKALEKVPNSTFDIEKVELLVNEPYSDKDVLIGLYKLQLKDEAFKKHTAVIGRIQTINFALLKLNLLHAEIASQKTDNDKVSKLIADIDALLNFE